MSQLSQTTFRVATYNAHRVFDAYDDPKTRDGRPKSERSLQAVAQVLSDCDADIVALQEIENVEMLEDIQGRGDLFEKYPHCVLVEGHDKKGIDVAFMSRYPIKHFESHAGESGSGRRFQRPLLEIEVDLPDQSTLTVFNGHFVASFNDWCDSQRLWEAAETSRLAALKMREKREGHVVVVGDLNDSEGSRVLRTLGEVSLKNATIGLPPSWGTTWKTQYDPALIDHILYSSSLAENFVDSGVFHHPEDYTASDHRLVWADFNLSSDDDRIRACQTSPHHQLRTAS